MAEQKNVSKKEIKRQIAQFLAGQNSDIPVSDLRDLKSEIRPPTSDIRQPTSEISQTTFAEIKKIAILVSTLLIILALLTLLDRRFQTVGSIGSYLSDILGL